MTPLSLSFPFSYINKAESNKDEDVDTIISKLRSNNQEIMLEALYQLKGKLHSKYTLYSGDGCMFNSPFFFFFFF